MIEDTPQPPSQPAVPVGQGPTEEGPEDAGGRAALSGSSRPAYAEQAAHGDPLTREGLQHLVGDLARHFPARYDRTELVLLDVDPHHLHAYWNIHQNDLAKALRDLGHSGPQGPMLLRVREVLPGDGEAPGSGEVFDLAVHGLRNRWYVDVWKDGAVYEASLGLRGANGTLVWVARSNAVTVPRAGQSPDYDFPKLTVPTAETSVSDLPAGAPFDRVRVDPRFAALFPEAGSVVPARGWPAALAEAAEIGMTGEVPAAAGEPEPDVPAVKTRVPSAAAPPAAALGHPITGAAPAAIARLPLGISAGADEAEDEGEPAGEVPSLPPPQPIAFEPAPPAPEGGWAEAPAGETGEAPAAAAAPFHGPPGHVADDLIARLSSGEPIPLAAPGEIERVAGLGETLARLAETMETVAEPTASAPEARTETSVPDAAPAAPFAPGRMAVFGAEIDGLEPAPFGPRGEPVVQLPDGGDAADAGRPEAGDGAHPPGAAPPAGEEPLPLESVLSLSSFAFGREDVSLEVNAELHIFGRARPGAKLTMFGQRLRLLPDGSFSIRRPLPHGSLVLPILMSHGLGAGEGGGGD
jgi:hypothetical protein